MMRHPGSSQRIKVGRAGRRRDARAELRYTRHFVTEIHTHGLAMSSGETKRETRRKYQPA